MPVFDPDEFFRFANQLVQDNPNEAALRSAISRAYYACHLVARDQLFGVDHAGLTSGARKRIAPGPAGKSEHKVVQLAVGQNRTFRSSVHLRLENKLGQLQSMREAADYLRNTDHVGVVGVFTAHGVRDWAGLARASLTLASDLLPEVHLLKP